MLLKRLFISLYVNSIKAVYVYISMDILHSFIVMEDNVALVIIAFLHS